MDFLSITPFNNLSPTGGDSFLAAREPAIAAINPILRPPPKRPAGRPKGSKNKPKTTLPPPSQPLRTSRPRLGKRPMGRPKGSKNKPKNIELESETNNVIIIPAGSDIMQQLLEYCCQFHASITVFNASGELSNIVPYYQPHLSIPGPLTIRSFSCTILPPPPPLPLCGTTKSKEIGVPFIVSLSSPNQGRVCNGMVGKSATAVSKVEMVVKITTITSRVEFDTICNGQANNNNGKGEIKPVASLLRPQDLKHLTFREFYNYCNPDNPLENLLTMKINNTLFDDDDDEI